MADRTIRSVLRAETAQYQRDMQAAAKATNAVGEAGVSASRKGQGAFKSLSESARESSAEWTELGQTLTGIGAIMAGLGGATLAVGISYNTLQQQSRAALTSLTGSAEAANVQMDKLDAFAKNSPFAKQVFIQAQQQMLGFGIAAAKVVPYLDAIQNAVAASGGSNHDIAELSRIMSQISASAKITATDLREFGNRGIDAATLIGSQMGMTGAEIRESITAGTLDAGEALDALAAGMSERFDGAAAGVKDTMVGAFDRVKAAFRDLASELATPLVDPEGGGLLVDAANGVADLMRNLQGLPTTVKVGGGALFGLATAATLAGGAFLVLTPRIVAAREAARTLGPQFAAAGKAMLTWRNAGKLAAGVAGMTLAATGLAEKTGMANTANLALMGTIAGPWGAAIGGGIGLLLDMGAAGNRAEKAMAQFYAVAGDTGWLRGLQANVVKTQESLDSLGDEFGFDEGTLAEMSQGAQDIYDRFEDLGRLLAATPENNWAPSIDEMDAALRDALPVAQELFPKIVSGMEDLAKLDYGQWLELDQEMKNLAAGSEEAADGLESLGLSAEEAQDRIDNFKERLREAREAGREAGSSFIDLSKNIDDSKVSLDKWLTTLEKQLVAMQNFGENIATLMERGLSPVALEKLVEQGEAGALRAQQLAEGPKRDIERFDQVMQGADQTATNFGRDFGKFMVPKSKEIIDLQKILNGELDETDGKKVDPNMGPARNSLADLLGVSSNTNTELDKTDKKKVNPHVNSSSILTALGHANNLNSTLDYITRNRTVRIAVSAMMAPLNPIAALRNMAGSADGGTIRRYDVGGTVAGQREPYGDKVLTYLAPGEEVISNRFGQADRHRDLLKAINSNSLANGGTVQSLANGGTAGGGITSFARQLGYLSMSLKALRRELVRSRKAIDNAKQRRDDVKATRDALAEAIKSSYRTDLFAAPSNIWASGASMSPLSTLQSDIADIKALNRARAQLANKGVRGGALDTLLQQGSLADVQAMAGWSKADLKAYSALYSQRESLLSRAGTAAGRSAYAAELKQANRELRGLRQENKQLRRAVNRVEKATKNAGKNAKAGRRGEAARAGRNIR